MECSQLMIPCHIMNNNKLSDGEKLLYGAIQGSSCEYGFCIANDEYLAKLFCASLRQVQRYIQKLSRLELIFIEFSEYNTRRIWTLETWQSRVEIMKALEKYEAQLIK